jgi:23S rRNA pseudouridine2605 synthase
VTERLQKLLSEAGIASRRQVEAWIRAGRVTVNGQPAVIGQRASATDRILVDGQKLRLAAAAQPRVLAYHRPPGEPLKAESGASPVASYDRLPKVPGSRWLPLSPLAPIDGGLELFTTDGVLRAAAGKLAHQVPLSYTIRVRGDTASERLSALIATGARGDPPLAIDDIRVAGGEGRNVWIELAVRGARGRDLRALLAASGYEVSRVMRTRYGNVTLDPALSRGEHRDLDEAESAALYAELGAIRRPSSSPVRRRAASGGRSHRPGPRVRGRVRS